MSDVDDVLTSLGMDDKESTVYHALLRLGTATASNVATKTGISRPLVYEVIERLINDGYASETTEDGVKQFSAKSPTVLRERLEQKLDEVEMILPDLLEAQASTNSTASVELHKGKEGIKTVLYDIIETGEDYCVIGEGGNFRDVIPVFIQKFFTMLEEHSINERVLLPAGRETVQSPQSTARYLEQAYIPEVTTLVFAETTCMFIWNRPYFVITIRNRAVADSYRTYFDAMWSEAQP